MRLAVRTGSPPARDQIVLVFLFAGVAAIASQAIAAAPTTTTASGLPLPEDYYGLWTLTPAIVAIVVAVALRQVFPALTLGVLTASIMVMPCLPTEQRFGGGNHVVTGVRLAAERYLVGAVIDPGHTKTLIFTLTIAGMVGIIHANGGTAALVGQIAGLASTRRRGQLATFFAGLVIFFDDYSNCMIIGPTMRPMLDRLRVSRQKLAFILDATAAPVASLALFGTWIGTEVGFIQAGLDMLKSDGALPEFLHGMTAYDAFLQSLPYRYYALFALVLVFVLAVTGRDFGPMLAAERRVQSEPMNEADAVVGAAGARPGRWWYAGIPVGGLIVATIVILGLTGWSACPEERTFGNVLKYADAYAAILYGAMIAATLAVAVSLVTRALTLSRAVDEMLGGMQRMLPAIVVLIFAWALSAGMQDLHLGKVAVRELQAHRFSPHWLPLLIFASACVVSFATGTSWGTMGILCPVAVLLAGHLASDLPKAEALSLFYGTVGSVLAGAVFGDHCSPISDTTVLSALASNCSLESHVWTQIPYALVAAAMEVAAGDLLCGYFGLPVWVGLAVGTAGLVVIVLAFGRRVETRVA